MKVRRLSLTLIACALIGCTTPQSVPLKTDRYIVTADSTPFYKYGPAQSNGADFMLVKDQRVTVLSRAFGYSQVVTEKGQAGFVPTDDIAPAPPPPPPPKPPKPSRSKRTIYDQLPPPNFDVPPQGLPDPNIPVPSFRY